MGKIEGKSQREKMLFLFLQEIFVVYKSLVSTKYNNTMLLIRFRTKNTFDKTKVFLQTLI